MNYTPCCGEPVIVKAKTVFVCPKCSGTHYINPKAAAAIILRQGQHYIMARRAIEPHKGKLDVVGGFVDVGENFEQAIKRELMEEAELINLTIDEMDQTDFSWLGMSQIFKLLQQS